MLEFDLTFDVVPVTLKTVDENGNPKTINAEIRELSGEERDTYLNGLRKNIDGTKIKDYKGIQSNLVHACLWDTLTNERVPLKTIKGFRSSVQTKLFEECSTISGIKPEEDKTEGED